MSATITWNISQLDCVPNTPEGPNYVVTAHWQCSGLETNDDKTYSGYAYGTCSFSVVEGPSFTPYEDLTLEQVLGWCWNNGVDKDSVELSVQQQIDNQINPPVVAPPLPW